MSRFFVGQRVRVVKVKHAVEALGREGTITEFRKCRSFVPGDVWDGYEVDVDGIGTISPKGFYYGFPDFCLEPILPEGHQPAELTVEELL